jgi:hypothetical protein
MIILYNYQLLTVITSYLVLPLTHTHTPHARAHTHTHTHTYIYIYIYIYMRVYMSSFRACHRQAVIHTATS